MAKEGNQSDKPLDRATAYASLPLHEWLATSLPFQVCCTFIVVASTDTPLAGSSVCVERTLNVGRDVISLRRASLSAGTIRALMNLRSMLLLEKRLQPKVGHKRGLN